MGPQFFVYVKRGNSRRWTPLVNRWMRGPEFKVRLQQVTPAKIDHITWDRPYGYALTKSHVNETDIQVYQRSSKFGEVHDIRLGYPNQIPNVARPMWSRDYTDLLVYTFGGADYGSI